MTVKGLNLQSSYISFFLSFRCLFLYFVHLFPSVLHVLHIYNLIRSKNTSMKIID